MALVAYTKNVPRYASVAMGVNKIPGYTVLTGTFNDSGSKTVPYLNSKPFTQREVSRTDKFTGPYSGKLRSLPYFPYYGEGYASLACVAFANDSAVGNISALRIAYEKGITRNLALSRFVEEMMGDLSSSALGVSIIEGRDSLNMIKARVGNLAKTLINLRKGRMAQAREAFSAALQTGRYDTVAIMKMRRKRAKYFNDLSRRVPGSKDYAYSIEKVGADKASSLWLEYWLGWAPMISDIGKLIDVLGDAVARLPTEGIIIKASAKRTIEINYTEVGACRKTTVPIHMLLDYRRTLSGRVAIGNHAEFLNRRAGLTNLPAVIWAGVPFSFIIDWFVGIGKVLELTDSFTGIRWITGTQSDKYSLICNERLSHRESNGGQWDCESWTGSSAEILRRYVLSSAPTGSIVPRFKDLSTIFEGKIERAYTSVSLLTQFLISHRVKRGYK